MTIICTCGQHMEHLTALLEHYKTVHSSQVLKPHLLLWGIVEILRTGDKP